MLANFLYRLTLSHTKLNNVSVSTTGVSHDELVTLARQHFSDVSFEYEGDAVPIPSPCRFTGSEVRVVYLCVRSLIMIDWPVVCLILS